MKNSTDPQSHRFVIVYRTETREIADAAVVWRGWVERVPDPRQIEAEQAEGQRLGFHALDELPGLIRALMDQSGAQQRPAKGKTPDRRPQS